MNILIIEDNPRDADLIRRHLPEHAVAIADTIESAWELILAMPDRWELCLLDLYLPDGSGANLLARIRLHGLPIAVVVLTGSTDMGLTITLMREGANDFLVKDVATFVNLGRTVTEARERFLGETQRRRMHLAVLYADRDPAAGEAVHRHLESKAPHLAVSCVSTAAGVLERLGDGGVPVEVVVIDLRLPDVNSLHLLKALRHEHGCTLPIIVASHPDDEAIAVQALRLGASDWVSKQEHYPQHLVHAIESAHARHLLDGQNRELQQALARYRATIDQTPDHFLTCSAAFEITGTNRRLRAAMGWDREPTGSPLSILVHPQDQARLHHLMVRLGPDAQACTLSIRMLLSKDTRWFEWRVSRIVDPHQRFIEYQIFARATAGYEDALERMLGRDRSWEENAALRDYCQRARTTAHDVNNLLAVALGSSDILRGLLPPDTRCTTILDRIGTATRRGGALLKQLQDSRPAATEDRGGPTLLGRALAEFQTLVQPVMPAHVLLSQHVLDDDLAVMMDPETLSRVLLNLITNARDALPAGGSIHIRAFRSEDGNDAVIEVEDDGVGIPPDLMPRIFEPHVTTKATGSGLGLASCRRAVSAAGGSISATSEPGSGTLIAIRLPASRMVPVVESG